ncbi:amidase [Bordetella tumbae]|uniref:amidase n=1 Tax=Bordetella tumbae TaxID=1649139 RepID=UPI0039F0611A
MGKVASLRHIHRALAGREITATALTEQTLRAAEASQRAVNAFANIDWDSSLTAASESDRRYDNGTARPLEGLPITIKDLIDTKDMDTCYGSLAYLGHRPAADADIVRSLLDCGAIIIGKTTTHEFAWGVTTASEPFGDTRNPLDPTRIPGGSSGGAAAAIAYGAVTAGVGSDTGGSVRIPAALCGLVGFKPTLGRLSTRGVFPLSPTCDHVGLLGRQVDDVLYLGNVLNCQTPESHAPSSARLGVVREIAPVSPAADVALPFDAAVRRLARKFSCVELDSAGLFDGIFAAFSSIVLIEGGIEHFRRNSWDRIVTSYRAETVNRLERARDMDMRAYVCAQRARGRFIASLHDAMHSVEYLILPTCPCTAPALNTASIDIGNWSGTVREALMTYTAPFNIAGFPAISIPIPAMDKGLPASLQIVARPGDDGALLHIAQQIEAIVCGDGTIEN